VDPEFNRVAMSLWNGINIVEKKTRILRNEKRRYIELGSSIYLWLRARIHLLTCPTFLNVAVQKNRIMRRHILTTMPTKSIVKLNALINF
jgi:hypothetical protein